MNNLIDIQKQIDKLQKQAEDIKVRECDKTISDIVAKMQLFGISVKDLQLEIAKGKDKGKGKIAAKSTGSANKARKAAAKPVSVPAPVKFRGPNNETWSGRGLTPRWLSALLSQGRTKEEFSVGS